MSLILYSLNYWLSSLHLAIRPYLLYIVQISDTLSISLLLLVLSDVFYACIGILFLFTDI